MLIERVWVLAQAGEMLKFCADNHRVPDLIRPLKLFAVKWHTAVGLALVATFLVYPFLPSAPQFLLDLWS